MKVLCKQAIHPLLGICVLGAMIMSMPGATVINVPGDYSKVQDAINAASSGDTVAVAAGRYAPSTNEEAFPISMKDGVRLLGAGASVCSLDAENTNRVINCAFMYNSENIIAGFTITNGNSSNWGGGIACHYTTITISDNIITENAANDRGAGIRFGSSSSGSIINNIISNNTVGWFGGGIECMEDCSPSIVNNIISDNTSTSGGGGGINCYHHCSPNITNNLIIGNSANIDGGGITCYDTADAVFTNNIICSNSGGFAGIFSYLSALTINYSDVWNNSPANYYGCSAGTDCISEDPLFVNAGSGDYHLQTSSPCIDTGDNYAPDIPAYDFDGYARIIDGNNDGSAVVDLGPFEHPEIVGLREDISNILPVLRVVKTFPNPFGSQTTVRYSVLKDTEIEVAIYNVLGEKIVSLFHGIKKAGTHEITWHGTVEKGKKALPGVYYIVYQTDNQKVTQKLIMLR